MSHKSDSPSIECGQLGALNPEDHEFNTLHYNTKILLSIFTLNFSEAAGDNTISPKPKRLCVCRRIELGGNFVTSSHTFNNQTT